jgi:hypothetical protein
VTRILRLKTFGCIRKDIQIKMDNQTLSDLATKVSRYFLEFLESDFKRQSAPRRKITLQTESGFRAGMKVSNYPGLNSALWAALATPSNEPKEIKLTAGQFTRPMTSSLKGVIKEQILAIEAERINSVQKSLVESAISTRIHALDNPERWIDEVRLSLASSIGEQIVRPLIAILDGPLSSQSYSLVDSIFALEGELIERLGSDLDGLLPEILARYLALSDEGELVQTSAATFTLDTVQRDLISFFETFATADAFLEFRDLDTYAKTSEGKQLYLYIGALRFAAGSYPLFFVPIDIERTDKGFELKLTSHVYANKRAIDFVLQETASRQSRQWISPIDERIFYLNPNQTILDTAIPLFQRIAVSLNLGGTVELSEKANSDSSSTDVSISSNLHLAVFDSADEALVNDYEEILSQLHQQEPGVVELFEGIIRDVILENPRSIAPAVDIEWDAMPLVDRLVFDGPIPLNEEQIKILKAVRMTEGKFVLVEGPPGCGKSHTITAIASDCILSNKSCLVLSDKREALDVVQSKVSETMSRVRHDSDFPNPILRLGQQQTNFRKLISGQTLNKVMAYVKSAKSNETQLNLELEHKQSLLKSNISKTAELMGGLAISDIEAIFRLEAYLDNSNPNLSAEIIASSDLSIVQNIERLFLQMAHLRAYLEELQISGSSVSADRLHQRVQRDAIIAPFATSVNRNHHSVFKGLTLAQLRQLTDILFRFEHLKMPIFGYLFRGAAVRKLEKEILHDLAAVRLVRLKQDFAQLRRIVDDASLLARAIKQAGLADEEFKHSYEVLTGSRATWPISEMLSSVLNSMYASNSGIPFALLQKQSPSKFAELWVCALKYILAWHKTTQAFMESPQFDYLGMKAELERLRTSQMNTEVDMRLVSYMDNYRADARTLASLISQRQKFPEEKFDQVKESFPLILASIREFGEYMPLVPDLFDVVVIDEASQVSIAQAFPALLRAKKVVVLGDSKQFSNTKSTNASIALNDKYRSDLQDFFTSRVSSKHHDLRRLDLFDVKRSVLEFVKSCANYEILLRKHFRSYQELISYSSRTFYGGSLQALKVRGCPIGDVIRFSEVEIGNCKVSRGTNEAEGKFLLARLYELLESPNPPSVGIITPFRDQQIYLSRILFSDLKGAEFESKLKLKVMTFDSCQGEERQIIFYSMVATEEFDALNYIFPVELGLAEENVEEKLKMQRLNVGFSRAQEMIWFLLSKPIDKFRGSISDVLRHYKRILDDCVPTAAETDQSSPMESRVLTWICQTAFYQMHEQDIEIVAQFPIGDYLRQLDPNYKHSSYKCDFLFTYQGETGQVRIIIEYDGFEYHFRKGAAVNVGNYERYMVESDVERQLILESYGYRFLRINRFNLGKDPVTTLSERLFALTTEVQKSPASAAIDSLQAQALGLSSKEMKACTRCKKIKELSDFYDYTLETKYGRVCNSCKRYT